MCLDHFPGAPNNPKQVQFMDFKPQSRHPYTCAAVGFVLEDRESRPGTRIAAKDTASSLYPLPVRHVFIALSNTEKKSTVVVKLVAECPSQLDCRSDFLKG